jgi:hypothetical protein
LRRLWFFSIASLFARWTGGARQASGGHGRGSLGNDPHIRDLPTGQDHPHQPSTGTIITINVAGPLQITETPDTFRIVGIDTAFWLTYPGTDERGLYQSAGRWDFFIDAAGNASFKIVGQITSLCPQLAA